MERELLLVASASAGVMAYHWDGTSTPRLVSRYPFVDYSKEIVIWHNGTVLLADNYETGLQVLSYTDPLKPRQLNSFQSGFVDSVTITGNMLAITDRRRGARILAVGPDGKTTPILDVPPLPATDPRGPDLKKVVFGPDARLMICEGPAGAQLVRFPMRGGKVAPNTVFRFDESGVMDAVFLDPGSALLSLMPGGIRLIRLPG
jgi:hypothetical protein